MNEPLRPADIKPPLRYHVTERLPGGAGWRCLTCTDDRRAESDREHQARTAYQPESPR